MTANAQTTRQANSPAATKWRRDVSYQDTIKWLKYGLNDLKASPGPSLFYGAAVFCVSVAVVTGLVNAGLDYIIFPALSGFLVLGPFLAIGLYEQSRALQQGKPLSIKDMLLVNAKSGGQIWFVGVMLCALLLLWLRSAVLLYALFFGLVPFPGFENIIFTLITTPRGIGLLVVGSAVGGLFAAFSFAISVLSVPMLLDKKTDALTAMGSSMAVVWNNRAVLVVWGGIILCLGILSVATGLLGLIVVFPLLGYASWHAYRALS